MVNLKGMNNLRELKVFISSTYKDLINYRQAIDEMLHRLDLKTYAMEFFGSRTDDVTEICKEMIDKCDFFIGIYAWRYGYIPRKRSHSITELEFDYAMSKKKCCLCYIADSNHTWLPSMMDDEEEMREKLKKFKIKVGKKVIRSTFTTTDNLAYKISVDITREILNEFSNLACPNLPTKPIFEVPYFRNKFFTGRDQIIEDIHQSFCAGQNRFDLTQAIIGLGGVGKTQLALEYAYRYRNDYLVIFWINSNLNADLLSNYASLTRSLGLILKNYENLPERAEIITVCRWLENNSNWLLIFDNVNDPNEIEKLLPKSGNGHIIITSCFHHWEKLAKCVSIKTMPIEEAVDLLLKETSTNDIDSAKLIALELGCLPLALAQAAAYIRENNESLSTYYELYKQWALKLFEYQYDKINFGYDKTILTTWEMAFSNINKNSEKSVKILNYIAFIDPNNISNEFLLGIKDLEIVDKIQLNNCLHPLLKYSIINKTENGILIHRLVQEVIRYKLSNYDRKSIINSIVNYLNEIFPIDIKNTKNWDVCNSLLSHISLVTEYSLKLNFNSKVLALLLCKCASYLNAKAYYTDCRDLLINASSVLNNLEGGNSRDYPMILYHRAELERMQGNNKESESYYLKAIEILEKYYEPNHFEFAKFYQSIGLLYTYDEQENLNKAEEYLIRALNIYRTNLGESDLSFLECLVNLGEYYNHIKIKNHLQAKEIFIQVCIVLESMFDPSNIKIPIIYARVGESLCYLGEYQESMEYTTKAFELFEKNLTSRHPFSIETYHNMGFILKEQNKYEEALQYFIDAFKNVKIFHMPEHRNYSISLGELLKTLILVNRYSELEEIILNEIHIYEKINTYYCPDLFATLEKIIIHYCNLKSSKKLKLIFDKTITYIDKYFSSKYDFYFLCWLKLFELYIKENNVDEARNLIVFILRKMNNIDLSEKNNDYLSQLKSLKKFFDKIRKYKIDNDYKKFLLNFEKILFELALKNIADNAVLYNEYALFLKNSLNDFDAAELHYRKAIELEPNDSIILNNYALFLTSVLKKHDEAEIYYQKSVEIGPINSNSLGNYAFFIHQIRRNEGKATPLYDKALEIAQDANIYNNYASLLVCNGDWEKALLYCNKALSIQRDSDEIYNRYTARILLMKSVIELLNNKKIPNQYLGQLKFLFNIGIDHAPWEIYATMDYFKNIIDDNNYSLIKAILNAINEEQEIEILNSFPIWRNQEEIALEITC